MRLFTILVLALAGAQPAAAQSSNAARYLAGQEIAAACEFSGGSGGIADGLFERDLDGDGRDDLLISHEGIDCASGRSAFCGMQVCSFKIWLRRGDLLEPAAEALGGGIEIGPGSPPVISGFAHGGARWQMRWNGRTFAR